MKNLKNTLQKPGNSTNLEILSASLTSWNGQTGITGILITKYFGFGSEFLTWAPHTQPPEKYRSLKETINRSRK